MSAELKLPPHSLEAEQAVIGGLLLDNDAWDRIAGRISESDFYREDHRLLFRGIESLADAGKPRDVVTIAEWLRSHDLVDRAGGTGYVGNLAADTPSAANITAYADIVRERSVTRQLIAAGSEIAELGFAAEGRSVPDLLDEAEKRIFAIADQSRQNGKGALSLKQVLPQVVERIEYLHENQGAFTGLATGLNQFDQLTNGLQNSDLIILAARPSMGKTSLAMNMVEHVTLKLRQPAAVFSMEMSAEQLVMRMISSWGRVDQSRLRSGHLEDEDWPRITSAIGIMNENANLFIDDTPALSPSELRARARRLKREHDIGLIMVDYMQLMQVPGTKENRTNEISEISRNLKALAKELDVPVIALSQLNRSVEQRDNKRPRMSDLRESGGIEQDADLIVFIYRDEVYNEDSDDKGVAEILLAKQRNGPLGTCRAAFLGHFTRFENLQDHYEDDFG
ncbi:replicative DNA helicase [Salinisphaera sp. P385]|uniref:Replicative DNA helicase n=1 Tax=Spectribacter acetivorans TaxID=3075603 RepID=A0ABU3B6F0_9GAMM|nr:replicative DNA helicase [Salinisphaera sp. P385]MDT0617778.1 replicative DNA helicase [Salinisphaera sp. P385]